MKCCLPHCSSQTRTIPSYGATWRARRCSTSNDAMRIFQRRRRHRPVGWAAQVQRAVFRFRQFACLGALRRGCNAQENRCRCSNAADIVHGTTLLAGHVTKQLHVRKHTNKQLQFKLSTLTLMRLLWQDVQVSDRASKLLQSRQKRSGIRWWYRLTFISRKYQQRGKRKFGAMIEAHFNFAKSEDYSTSYARLFRRCFRAWPNLFAGAFEPRSHME